MRGCLDPPGGSPGTGQGEAKAQTTLFADQIHFSIRADRSVRKRWRILEKNRKESKRCMLSTTSHTNLRPATQVLKTAGIIYGTIGRTVTTATGPYRGLRRYFEQAPRFAMHRTTVSRRSERTCRTYASVFRFAHLAKLRYRANGRRAKIALATFRHTTTHAWSTPTPPPALCARRTVWPRASSTFISRRAYQGSTTG